MQRLNPQIQTASKRLKGKLPQPLPPNVQNLTEGPHSLFNQIKIKIEKKEVYDAIREQKINDFLTLVFGLSGDKIKEFVSIHFLQLHLLLGDNDTIYALILQTVQYPMMSKALNNLYLRYVDALDQIVAGDKVFKKSIILFHQSIFCLSKIIEAFETDYLSALQSDELIIQSPIRDPLKPDFASLIERVITGEEFFPYDAPTEILMAMHD